MFDAHAPGYPKFMPGSSRVARRLHRLSERIDLHWGNFLACESSDRFTYVKVKSVRFKSHVKHWFRVRLKGTRERINNILHPLPQTLRNIERINLRSMYQYRAKVYSGRVTLFRATKMPAGAIFDSYLGWGGLVTGGFECYDVPGYHGAIAYAPRAKILAEYLKPCLERAYAAHSNPPSPSRHPENYKTLEAHGTSQFIEASS